MPGFRESLCNPTDARANFAMLLMIDNYDSFTYNVVQYLSELKAEVLVVRNDEWSVEQIRERAPERIVISPGPGTPEDAGISLDVINAFAADIPILGICLGHQAIGEAFGAKVVRAKRVMHGKTSSIFHTGKGVFKGLENPFVATRYHSLVIDQASMPSELELTAWTQNEDGSIDEIMGVQHKKLNIHGVQFHPESILTACGHALLQNFLDYEL